MANRKPLTDEDGEVRELTSEDFAQMVPLAALPREIQELLAQAKTIRPEAGESPSKLPAA